MIGVLHVAGGGRCSWFELAVATFDGGRRRLPRAAAAVPPTSAAPLRVPPARRSHHPATPRLPAVAGRTARPSARVEVRPMRLLVCGGAGFIGSNFVRLRLPDHGDEVTVLDKLTYAGRRRPRGPDVRLVVGGIEDPAAVAEALEGADAVVNFAAETHVDRSIPEPACSSTRTRWARTCCSTRRASAGCATCRSRPTRSTARSRRAVHGGDAAAAVLALLRQQGRRRPARRRYLHTFGLETLICRGSNNYGPYQFPEKLIPLMVINALHGDPLPVYGDGMQVRNWIYVEDFARGIGTVLERGGRARSTTSAAPTSRPTSRSSSASRAHGRRRVADRVRQRPPRATTAATRSAPRRCARSAGRRRCASPRGSSGRSPGTATTAVVGADPLGRLPRLLRAPVRARARLSEPRRRRAPLASHGRSASSRSRAYARSPRRTFAVAGLPLTSTSSTSRSKSSASLIALHLLGSRAPAPRELVAEAGGEQSAPMFWA